MSDDVWVPLNPLDPDGVQVRMSAEERDALALRELEVGELRERAVVSPDEGTRFAAWMDAEPSLEEQLDADRRALWRLMEDDDDAGS